MNIDQQLEKFKWLMNSSEVKNIDHLMPAGFPIDGFLKAWFLPFQGYDLNWIELEILYRTFQFIAIKPLRDAIIQDFPKEAEKDFSTFYRKVKQMIDRNLLNSAKEGRETLVKITEEGAIELGKYYRYNMFKTFTIVQTTWNHRLATIIRNKESCIHEKILIGIFNSILVFNDYLLNCEQLDKNENIVIDNKEKIFLQFHDKGQNSKSENTQIQIIHFKGHSLLVKKDFADLFISNNLLANLDFEQAHKFLEELQRIMKSGANLYLSEFKEDIMNPMIENWSLFTHIMQFSQQFQTWEMKPPHFSTDEITDLLTKYFINVKVETYGFSNLFSAKKE
jgi:hypothetical protein